MKKHEATIHGEQQELCVIIWTVVTLWFFKVPTGSWTISSGEDIMQDLIVCRATKSSHPNKTSAASPKHRVLHTPPDRWNMSNGYCSLSMYKNSYLYLCNEKRIWSSCLCVWLYTHPENNDHDRNRSPVCTVIHIRIASSWYMSRLLHGEFRGWPVRQTAAAVLLQRIAQQLLAPCAATWLRLQWGLQENHETWLENWWNYTMYRWIRWY